MPQRARVHQTGEDLPQGIPQEVLALVIQQAPNGVSVARSGAGPWQGGGSWGLRALPEASWPWACGRPRPCGGDQVRLRAWAERLASLSM